MKYSAESALNSVLITVPALCCVACVNWPLGSRVDLWSSRNWIWLAVLASKTGLGARVHPAAQRGGSRPGGVVAVAVVVMGSCSGDVSASPARSPLSSPVNPRPSNNLFLGSFPNPHGTGASPSRSPNGTGVPVFPCLLSASPSQSSWGHVLESLSFFDLLSPVFVCAVFVSLCITNSPKFTLFYGVL